MTRGIFASLVLAACASAADTVILVRHAERSGPMMDGAGLSDAGKCRAEVLANMVANSGVTAIYTTEIARTQETAAPSAKKLNLRLEAIPGAAPDQLVAKVKAAAGTVLVVGHSNTVPDIVRRLGANTPPIDDKEYDRLLILTFQGTNPPALVTLRYPGCGN